MCFVCVIVRFLQVVCILVSLHWPCIPRSVCLERMVLMVVVLVSFKMSFLLVALAAFR